MSVDKNNHANGRFEDLTGWKMWEHGVPDSRLTVLRRVENHVTPSGKKTAQWLCKCSCPEHNTIVVQTGNLKNGSVRSCGCLATENSRRLLTGNKYGKKNKKYNDYDLTSFDYGVGYTEKGEEFYFDLEDYSLIKDYCWRIRYGYVVTKDPNTKKYIRMHRLIMNAHPDVLIDHKAHKTNDNRKQYLRSANSSTNHWNHDIYSNNTSGVTGVNWDEESNKWRARLWAHGKMYHLGRFDKFEDAVSALKVAVEKYFGEFSFDNSMKEDNNELQQPA